MRRVLLAALPWLLGAVCAGQSSSPITLDTSETLFTVLTAINNCAYDENLANSDPLRAQIRAEVRKNLHATDDGEATGGLLCDFYQTHRQVDATHDLSQYVSLALYLQGPPTFLPKVKEEEMPPDAAVIAPFGAMLDKFYDKAGIHALWEKYRPNYTALTNRYHEPLRQMVFDNEIYLKLQSGGYLGRRFTVYLDVMADPDEVNARNYGAEYDVVVFPSPDPKSESPLKMSQIRHTFLHYLLDPLADKHFVAMKRLEPILQSVKNAPLEEGFRKDISLLVTECLVRAIEIRTSGNRKTAEAMRAQAVDDAVKQGYILTRYFYDSLIAFEKDPAGIRTAYGDFLNNIDLRKEAKAASEVQFSNSAPPELVQLSRMEDRLMLVTAEKRLEAGDVKGAEELAEQAISRKVGDQGRALFVLARVAVANKDIAGARDNFQKAIEQTKDPTVIGWSHVYLGRILDLKEERDAAVVEYRAALVAGGTLPEIKSAAERGLQQAYEPPAKPQ